jgi:hypothetical protein
MTQFTLNLIKGSSRPIVKLKEFHNLKALLDTGAYLIQKHIN